MFKFTNISLALLRHGNLIKRRKLLEFDYKSTTFRKVRVAFNNVYRRVLGLPKWSSSSEIYAIHNIENFEAILRKVI